MKLQQRFETEQAFMDKLWNSFLNTTILPSETTVRAQIFAEVLKILLNPVIQKAEKVKVLQNIQQIFSQQSPATEEALVNDLIDPFIVLCGSLLHYESVIGNLVNKKQDLLYQAYMQCTFKPQTNEKMNEKLAKSRYEKDASLLASYIEKLKQSQETINQSFPTIRQKSPSTDQQRLLVLHIDGKRRQEQLELK